MANDLLTYPETESRTASAFKGGSGLDVSLGAALKEKPIWADLYENIRDIFFPPHLPPLELTSKPIPVPDRMKVKANPWAIGIATALNVAILVVAIAFGVAKVVDQVKKNDMLVTPVEVSEFKAPKKDALAGGGGGSPGKMEATKGKIPPRAKPLDIAPQTIAAPVPTIDVQKDILIPDNRSLPNFGMSNSPNVKLGSLGNGSGMGVGNGNGPGYGIGSGGNIGGGLYRVGGAVSGPVALNSVEAEFSDEARRNKYQGVCLVSFIVDVHGDPLNPRVVRSLGEGLDEKAIEAVMKYKFKPAMKDGKTPVPVMITVEVTFRIY
ncbi:MAG: TonB family protein [Terracidiphilus sp.]|jgi:TonB family protein